MVYGKEIAQPSDLEGGMGELGITLILKSPAEMFF